MRQAINNITSANVTKTEKIKQLTQLGLSRRAIADLITNGNTGFVYNVQKKYGLLTTLPTTQIALDLGFNRNFGIEIEGYNCTRQRLAEVLTEAGIEVEIEGYNHATRRHWKLVTDASLSGNNTFELVSPILHGEEGLKELKIVCYVLEFCGAKVNNSCGLHVHMSAEDFDLDTWKCLVRNYMTLERTIDAFMPESRRNNRFCLPMNGLNRTRIEHSRTFGDLKNIVGSRYYKVNLQAYDRHKTVEFRQHSGSTDFLKIENWLRFLNGFVTFAKSKQRATRTDIESLPFLAAEQKIFYKLRTQKLA